MTRAEDDDWMDGKPPVTGTATLADGEDHGPHVFLYVPDISERTGWSTHRVPDRVPERATHPVGFRRRER